MRLSASRIRSINRSIARVNGIICGASDRIPQRNFEAPKAAGASISPRDDQGRRGSQIRSGITGSSSESAAGCAQKAVQTAVSRNLTEFQDRGTTTQL